VNFSRNRPGPLAGGRPGGPLCAPVPARVLFLNDTIRNGGPGRSLQALLAGLDPARVHRTVLLPRPGEIADLLQAGATVDSLVFEPRWVENLIEPWDRPIERADFQASRLRRGLRAVGNVGRMAGALWRLRRLCRTQGHELIYCNGTTANFMGAALGIVTGLPVLWHVRYTEVPATLRGLHDRLAASVAVRRIVCVSRPAAALFGRARAKVQVIPNGVDTRAFAPGTADARARAALGLPPDAVVFGSHGRILRKKGFVEMLMAAKMCLTLLRPAERARCHFLIVGDTPQDFVPDHLTECRQLAATLGIGGQVTFAGFQSDVRPWLRAVDVAVVPSIYPDPLPRAVIETMALGKPVVAFDVGGVGEMLGADQGTLLRGTPPDVEAMAFAFVRYLRDPALREQQGRAARARVLRDFDAQAHAGRIEGLILDLTARPPVARAAA
jgi:glycosyltransferase involved in cell wall biosynthesis